MSGAGHHALAWQRIQCIYEQHCCAVRKKLVRSIFDRAVRVIVLSDTWKTWLESISNNRHIVTIHNPVLLPPAPAPERPATDTVQLLVLGRLGQRKGSYDLLAAVAKIAPNFPTLQLNLAGDGELEQVAARARELGIASQVNVLGWVRGSDKAQYLQTANIYLLPSYNEGLPMSVLEAMAAGLPIITTPVGGIPDAVSDGVEGFLVAPGDVDALAARLTQLLLDQALMQKMGESARRKIENSFSVEAILPRLETLYADLGWCRVQ